MRVRRISAPDPGGTASWHPATDQLNGTDVYGPKLNQFRRENKVWSVDFENEVPGYNQFLFATGDCQKWMTMTKAEAAGSTYANARAILQSSNLAASAFMLRGNGQVWLSQQISDAQLNFTHTHTPT